MLPGQSSTAQGSPFQLSMTNWPGQPGAYANLSFSVPGGSTLAATQASVRVSVPPGQVVQAALNANGPPGLPAGTQYFVMSGQGQFGGQDVFTGASTTLLWMAGPYGGFFTIQRSDTTGVMTVDVAVSGIVVP